jgi:hypothetical protein
MVGPTTDPRTDPDAPKHNYGGTSPRTTLAWIIAVFLVFLVWLAFTYRHYFGASQFPQTSVSSQRSVAYAPDGAASRQ